VDKERYRITKELCEAHLGLIDAKADHLRHERAMWHIYLFYIEQGKEVYVKGDKHAALEKGESIPQSFFENEQFITREKLVELRDKDEIGVCFYEALLDCLDSGDAVLHDETTDEFRVISKTSPTSFLM